jgi:YHS domain-containing protein
MRNDQALRASLALALFTATLFAQTPELAVRGFDPVELCQGREVAGRPDLAIDRDGYTYRFAAPETQAEFAKTPTRYQIQLGGGCARMGPLSGRGSPERFAVHDGRIYIFASDGCRKGFLANPAKHLGQPDPVPTFTPAQLTDGAKLLARALEGLGGAAEVDGVTNLRWSSQQRVVSGGTVYRVQKEWHIEFPDAARARTAWNDSWWTTAMRGERGVMRDRKGERAMVDCQHDAFRQVWQRSLVPLLRLREREGFVAGSLGAGMIGERAVEQLVIAYRGSTVTFGVDPATGRIVASSYRDRTGGPVADVVELYDDFRDVGGLMLPFTTRGQANGKASDDHCSTWTAIERDLTLDATLFPAPK